MQKQWLVNLCDSTRIFTVIVVTQIMVLVYSLSFLEFSYAYLNRLSIISLLAQLIAISLIVLFCKLGFLLNKLGPRIGVLVVVILIVLISSIYTQMIAWLDEALNFAMLQAPLLMNIKLSVACTVTFLALLRYFYIQSQWLSQIEAASKSQMKALQARIKPHFLYNSMNSIAALIPIDAARAEQAVIDLSSLFRRAFSHNKNSIELSEEIEWVKQYLAIEKIRLGDRLCFQIAVESEDLLTHRLPVLCIQPLIENAIIHGIQTLAEGGEILLTVGQDAGQLVVQVSNPFSQENNTEGSGLGLSNISSRLKLQYATKATLKVHKEDKVFTVTMRMPL